MNRQVNSLSSRSALALRWSARLLSLLILLFWGYFIVAHVIGNEEPAPKSLTTTDMCSLAAMALSLAGLAIAWRWELAGGSLTLGAVLCGAIANWRSLYPPGTLIPIAALLYLISWRLTANHRED